VAITAMSQAVEVIHRARLDIRRNQVMNKTSEWQKKSAGWSKLRSG
jgi:hypothetical protein